MYEEKMQKLRKRFIPMSETMFYILLALTDERYGYGIMQFVKELTAGRIVLGAGTLYQSIGKLEEAEMIRQTKEDDRKKYYLATPMGEAILREEAERIREMYRAAELLK